MSQDFKLKFDEMREGKPTDIEGGNENRSADLFDTPSNVRNLCFEWPDGRMKFINYAYLISGELNSDNEIDLTFSTEKLKIVGKNLSLLFNQLTLHQIKLIKISESRYEFLSESHTLITSVNTVM